MAETGLIRDYIKGLSAEDFKAQAADFRKYAGRKTAFSNWDEKASLYPGLYVLGAISSLGKTSFCLQLADQLASSGETVVYFSLEQTKLEMASKSLSRYMYKTSKLRASATNIRHGCYEDKTPLDDRFEAVIDAYTNDVKDNLYIYECEFKTTIEEICDHIEKIIEVKNVRPIVFIDYLQILKSSKFSTADKQRIDYIVEYLKDIQKKHRLVFFVISSLNRQNYLTPVDYESFKESGGIEFTADVLLGLQLQAIHDEVFNSDKKIKEKREVIKKAKRETPRKVELVCLKNRYGIANYSCGFDYFPQYDLFVPDGDFVDLELTNEKPPF